MLKDATIVFDLDGTLVDTAPDLTHALNYALVKHGHAPVAADRFREAVGRGALAMIHEALGLDIPMEDLLADFLVYYEANIAVESRPFPGALAALKRLKAQGATLAVCTNKRERFANLLLHALELHEHFAVIAGRDTFAVSKPHPEHLLGTVAASGGERTRTVMVGDSITDIETARRASIPSVLVSFGYGPPNLLDLKADKIITHFDQLDEDVEFLLKTLTERDLEPS